ncbi:MAG: hypothetical protein EP340_05115 [Alphaproteobacteria bacterium]|nr:MAG: hypothetical protein EP340_05115 [Alphaproteobacteria bacterium]
MTTSENYVETNPSYEGLAARIIEHWKSVIADATTFEEPYEHIYVENIWPDDVYQMLRTKLPPVSLYAPINLKKWVRADGTSTRDRIDLTPENIAKFDDDLRDFWTEIKRAISSETMKRLVFEKLKKDLSLRLNVPVDDVVGYDAFVGGTLTRDTAEYRIKPHPDGYPRIVTMQFYLPESEDQEDLGTSLYVREPLHRRLLGKGFREVKRFPYRANSGYAFAVNSLPERTSYHGREYIEASAGVRNSLLFAWRAEIPTRDATSAVTITATEKTL